VDKGSRLRFELTVRLPCRFPRSGRRLAIDERGLPRGFREMPILAKPFASSELLSVGRGKPIVGSSAHAG
jgi:hypothetical protein